MAANYEADTLRMVTSKFDLAHSFDSVTACDGACTFPNLSQFEQGSSLE